MDQKHKIILLIAFIVALAASFFLIYARNQKNYVIINNVKIFVKTANTSQKQIKGLSGQKNLAENQGLLFVYPDYGLRNFWMKGMLFPIDIIWILDDRVIGFEKNVPASNKEPLPIYKSPASINYVLEVSSGFIDRHGIKIGDMVKFNLL
ncbi:DUF192 domain-containing protein [Candidatus Falkowbacteria bacterium]|nr:DUF192 domain-containing protein [Candidatus Falkowbacteria bacterium]